MLRMIIIGEKRSYKITEAVLIPHMITWWKGIVTDICANHYGGPSPITAIENDEGAYKI